MPERGLVAGTVVVVEQGELLGQRVMIRRHIASEFHDGRIAIALRHVAEHLIGGAIFLDDVEDVLDRRALSGMHRNAMRRPLVAIPVVSAPIIGVAISGRSVVVDRWQHVVVLAHLFRETSELAAVRDVEDGYDAHAILVTAPLARIRVQKSFDDRRAARRQHRGAERSDVDALRHAHRSQRSSSGHVLSPNRRTLAVVTGSNFNPRALHLIDVDTRTLTQTIGIANCFVGVAFSPAGNKIYVGGCAGCIRMTLPPPDVNRGGGVRNGRESQVSTKPRRCKFSSSCVLSIRSHLLRERRGGVWSRGYAVVV
jgi:hypothetical protein